MWVMMLRDLLEERFLPVAALGSPGQSPPAGKMPSYYQAVVDLLPVIGGKPGLCPELTTPR
jgi:hypothetical protein